ncbi:C25 family cysteine peptidase [Neolewinella agarilytica]|uniref:putative type IX secretion system sortase PorU2 n=1 Tax=Neolewinella agarilytica TaxID=478744 RepID=UPI00235393A1|nr:C25 family cysteine peptidase [Neolewinella agarilytica]
MFRTLYTLCILSLTSFLFAQMPTAGGEVLYGHEWIDYDRAYLKVSVVEDGIFRISSQQIASAGMALNETNTDKWTLHHKGQPVPIEVTSEGIVFYGEKNRGELDRHLFESPEEMQLNDRYSMHSDVANYYLSLAPVGGPFYQEAKVEGQLSEIEEILRTREVVFGEYMTKAYSRSAGASIYYSHYEPAEGFGSRSSSDLLSSNGNVESNATLLTPQANGNEARLTLRFGLGFGVHNQEIRVDNNLLNTLEATNWTVHQPDFSIFPNGDEVAVSLRGTASDQDKANLAWMNIIYPANLVLEESLREFQLPARANHGSLELTGSGADAGAMRLYSPASNEYMTGAVASGKVNFEIPASNDTLYYHLVLNKTYLSPAAAIPHRFSPTLPTDEQTNYLILTSRRLNGTVIEQMAGYRRSTAGGSYRVHIVNTEDLFDEFGYGVQNHPMAIRNYLAAARLTSPGLQYLFIVGKGREYPDIRLPDQLDNELATFFIPSFGFPASDNLLSADLGGVIPQLSTGRLSAISESEIAIYLEKLIEVEAQIAISDQTIEDRDWMKQVMHLAGGGTAGEQFSIQRNLARLEATIEDSEMSANVTSFFKTSSDPIESSQQENIFKRINDGTAIITFYGHSSSQGFDFSIDDPANYLNRGKYPYMLSLGCYSGDAFTKSRSISERFIFLPNKGAVAFAASKGVGFIGALGTFADGLYQLTANEEYGNGIGDALRKNIDNFSTTTSRSVGILLEQFSISGDPAYRLHPHPGPDLVIDPTSVRFTPEVIPVQEANYEIMLRVLNLGKRGNQDSVTLNFRQELPSGEIIELHQARVSVSDYENVTTIQLPSQGLPSVGLNRIFVTIDANNEIIELPAPQAEQNNELKSGTRTGVPLTFIANTAKVAFPPPYAVIGGQIELISSTTNALAAEREYLIQISDNVAFSNLLSSERIGSPGGVIRYQPRFTPTDSTTYYWRISPDSVYTEGAGYIWSESSFTWLTDQPAEEIGWAMQDPGQIIDGEFKNIIANAFDQEWNFTQTTNDIKIFNQVYLNSSLPRFEFNNVGFRSPFPWLVRAGIQVIVIDSTDNFDWLDNPGGLYNTPNRATEVWSFDTRFRPGREGLIDFIQNGIETGKYVMLYTAQRGSNIEYYNQGWNTDSVELGTSIFDVLEAEGSLDIRSLQNVGSVPYVFAFQKGLGAISETMASSQSDQITNLAQIKESWDEGTWKSSTVGPSRQWSDVSLKISNRNISQSDSARILVYGHQSASSEGVLLSNEEYEITDQLKLTFPISDIDPEEYPYLSFELHLHDSDSRTAPTLEHLYINFLSTGDVAISPAVLFIARDSLEQGENFEFSVGYENLSPISMDSILVELTTIDGNNTEETIRKKLSPLPGNGSDQLSMTLSTTDVSSTWRYSLRLNPDQDQPETITFNNTLTSSLKIGKDQIDPLINLFFDGRKISDGELVSAEPEIFIQIKDENPFLLLNDTSTFSLQLNSPSGQSERLRFNDSRITFIPATSPENTAEIYFTPSLLDDGTYTLIVGSTDRSGNNAGRLLLQKNFEVITTQRIGNVLAYPNPFTTQAHFVYTLTGSQPPSTFRIQIMTVSGRVVRDINLLEVEDIKIGTHRTNFAWDGTDEYGDLLANGVYLYRVITSDTSGIMLEKHSTGTEQFFKNDIGKIVLLR